jgi:hypothetical protein
VVSWQLGRLKGRWTRIEQWFVSKILIEWVADVVVIHYQSTESYSYKVARRVEVWIYLFSTDRYRRACQLPSAAGLHVYAFGR